MQFTEHIWSDYAKKLNCLYSKAIFDLKSSLQINDRFNFAVHLLHITA